MESVTSAVEDYAKAIYALETRARAARCRRTRSPSASASRAASASAMVQKLDELGLVTHVPYRGVAADRPTGATRRARGASATTACSSSTWPRTLGVPWDRVHDEAEVLEHVLSEELEELIAAKLGNPTHDPHGDPIPTRDLDHRGARHRAPARRSSPAPAAASCASPTPTPRCCATSPSAGSRPATSFEVVDKQPFDGPLFVALRRRRCTCSAASWPRAMRVEVSARERRHRRPTPPPRADAAALPRASELAARAGPRARRAAAARPGVRRRGRLRRPGQLRHQHRRRREVRLPAAVGDPRREPDGDARSSTCRRRSASRPARTCPSCAASTSRGPVTVRPVGAGRADRDRDRPRRVRRRRDRAQPAVRRPAVRRRPDHRASSRSAILALQTRGYRRFELAIAGLLGDRSCSASSTTRCRSASTRGGVAGGFVPSFEGTDSVLLAVGILGATVMPHVIYLHSALTQRPRSRRSDDGRAPRAAALPAHRRADRDGARRHRQHDDAASSPRRCSTASGLTDVDSIEGAHAGFGTLVGRRRGARLRGRAAGLRPLELERRHATPARSSCRASSTARSRCSCAGAITMAPALIVLGDRARPDRRARASARSCSRSASRSRSCR